MTLLDFQINNPPRGLPFCKDPACYHNTRYGCLLRGCGLRERMEKAYGESVCYGVIRASYIGVLHRATTTTTSYEISRDRTYHDHRVQEGVTCGKCNTA